MNLFKTIRSLFQREALVVRPIANMCPCQGGVMILNTYGDLYSVMPDMDSSRYFRIELVATNLDSRRGAIE